MTKKLVAEFLGTLLLVAVVVGSGIMGQNLSTDFGQALIINTISTVAALALLITLFGPISGAHFNPVVSLIMLALKKLDATTFLAYAAVQTAGASAGAVLANAMFDLAPLQVSENVRAGFGTWVSEIVATAGLLLVILVFSARNFSTTQVGVAVAAWIGSAYLFTASTSFANPAVTVGRIFSDTFAGIAPESVLNFVLCQFAGALLALVIFKTLFSTDAAADAKASNKGNKLRAKKSK
ncbi:aquaporin [Rhodoluna limnophila]|uniref:aquaporin n=1 Tax=Rhodoluna limnophila TaxID=232537 RepID=UPI00110644E0|nr:MIP/aquaporin family protein [Rhodoluna limnophila]